MADAVDFQQKVQQLQALSQQVQTLAQQRQQMEAMLAEGEMAKTALADIADDARVYRNVGALLIQDDKATAVSRITDDAETLELRIKRYKSQEETGRKQLEEMQTKLQAEFEKQQAAQAKAGKSSQ